MEGSIHPSLALFVLEFQTHYDFFFPYVIFHTIMPYFLKWIVIDQFPVIVKSLNFLYSSSFSPPPAPVRFGKEARSGDREPGFFLSVPLALLPPP